MGSPPEGLKKDASATVTCLAPDVCYTPVGPAQVPTPYQIVGFFDDSATLSSNVKFNGTFAFICEKSIISKVSGDEAGTGKGFVSGTVGAKAEPIEGSETVKINSKPVVCDQDQFKMNEGNTLGMVSCIQAAPMCTFNAAGEPGGSSTPAVTPKTEPQKSYWQRVKDWGNKLVEDTKAEGVAARQDPVDATVGVAKGAYNAHASLLELYAKSELIGGGAKMDQDSFFLDMLISGKPSTFWQDAGAKASENINLQVPLTSQAQQFGDKGFFVGSFVIGPLLKIGGYLKSFGIFGKLGKSAEVIETTNVLSKADTALEAEQALSKSAKLADDVDNVGAAAKSEMPPSKSAEAPTPATVAAEEAEKKASSPSKGVKVPPKLVKGGPHRLTSKPVKDGFDSHHMPAKDTYKNSGLKADDGPAIKMDPEDHKLTASWGGSDEAIAYRETQKALIEKGEFLKAIEMDIKDIQTKFPGKYDDAIKEMWEYAKSIDVKKLIKK